MKKHVKNEKQLSEAVIAALTNSDAYKYYNMSIESIRNNCKRYYEKNLNYIDRRIQECIPIGCTEYTYDTLRYATDYTIKNESYITQHELDDIINYYQNRGFQVHYIIYSLRHVFNRPVIKCCEMKIEISWDFSNFKF